MNTYIKTSVHAYLLCILLFSQSSLGREPEDFLHSFTFSLDELSLNTHEYLLINITAPSHVSWQQGTDTQVLSQLQDETVLLLEPFQSVFTIELSASIGGNLEKLIKSIVVCSDDAECNSLSKSSDCNDSPIKALYDPPSQSWKIDSFNSMKKLIALFGGDFLSFGQDWRPPDWMRQCWCYPSGQEKQRRAAEARRQAQAKKKEEKAVKKHTLLPEHRGTYSTFQINQGGFFCIGQDKKTGEKVVMHAPSAPSSDGIHHFSVVGEHPKRKDKYRTLTSHHKTTTRTVSTSSREKKSTTYKFGKLSIADEEQEEVGDPPSTCRGEKTQYYDRKPDDDDCGGFGTGKPPLQQHVR